MVKKYMGKIIVLALEGLEVSLVEKFKLNSLLQKYHGRYDAESEKYTASTLWASFLTGLSPEKVNLEFVERETSSTVKGSGFLKSLGRIIFKPRPPSVKSKYKTILDYFDRPLPFNVLSYNEEHEQFKVRQEYDPSDIIDDKSKRAEAHLVWKKLTIKLTEMFTRMLKRRKWDLAMTHLYYTDVVGHIFPDDEQRVLEAYRLVDSFVGELRSIFKHSIMLIVSNHGMKQGVHTNHGFWSSNVKIPTKPSSITDFFGIILKFKEMEDERKKIIKILRDLGYM